MPRALTLLAVVPTIVFILFSSLPPAWKDPYAWVDPLVLNSPAANGRSRRWFNMGYWGGTEDFSEAAEQLARKVLDFADAPAGGSVLDIAHGSGESLLLHLSSNPPRSHIHALTSLPADTARARRLVFSHKINNTIEVPVDFYVGSAVPQLGNVEDQSHPLNPMRGFLGRSATQGGSARRYEADEDGEAEQDDDDDPYGAQRFHSSPKAADAPTGYNLIYILDAIYHFPPSLGSFLSIAQKSLAPGGVIAYTDILPPPSGLNTIIAYLISFGFDVPLPNLTSRPRELAEYKQELEALGYEGVRVEDWSEHVWPAFAKNLKGRGGAWTYVGKGVDWAAATGWRSITVRAERGGAQP